MNQTKRKLPVYLTKKELHQLLSGIKKDRHKLGLAFMSYGGLRVSEMNNLKVSDINLARSFMKITGKGDKQRFVPLTAKLQNLVEDYLTKYGSSLSPESLLLGKTRASWHYVVKKYSSESLGRKDVHCHTLRHSFATALYHDGVEIEKISELLGHSRIDTTMIYSHISIHQKRDAVKVLDGRRTKVISFLRPARKKHDLSVQNYSDLVGREKELKELSGYLDSDISVILYGEKGCGKSAILRRVENAVYIDEYKKKQSLIKIILHDKELDESIYKETEKLLKKLSVDDLIQEIEKLKHLVVIDDITDLTKIDRKVISRLSEKTLVVTSTSRAVDKKLFKTYIEIKPLKRIYTRQILSGMIFMTDQKKKENVIDDILHTSGNNIKEAEYISNQLQLGKTTEEITTEERESNQVSIAPVLLIFVLFFAAWVFKSYTTSMVAMGYALLLTFRMLFYKYLFSPADRKSK